MAREFDDVVKKVAEKIGRGKVLLSEPIRAGRRRQVSVGPYRKAVGPSSFALCVLPALPGGTDCRESTNRHTIAKEFVRLVGKEQARDAMVRESKKHTF